MVLPSASSRRAGARARAGASSWLAVQTGLWLLCALTSFACGPSLREQQQRADAERLIAYWKAHEVEHQKSGNQAAPAQGSPSAVPDTSVPHLLCRDGTLSPTCSSRSEHGGCCANQGGVYVDNWGNVVLAH